MKFLQLLALVLIVAACSEKTTDEPAKKPLKESSTPATVTQAPAVESDPEELVDIKGHTFIQYYPGKKQIKFKGLQDDQKRRDGQWSYFSIEGKELSTTMYSHGKKHGHMIVKHENGALYYYGEMSYDKKIGIWKTYDEDGVFIGETDFGEAE
ncbi:MAG: hypothetical protein ACJA0U_002064 [Salibacteraceae bacterium]|jgi:hypothetical protein